MYLTPLKADNYFNINDIFTAINKLGIGKSPGEDGIHNIFLKNLPFDYVKKFILRLVNLSIYSDLPEVWKKATITMIPKKDQKSENPNEYRPVSLTSCLSKLIERLIKKSLYTFLEDKKLLVEAQSGFRNNRGTADNLIFVTQKLSECLLNGKKACGLFFDISKAFDKVWHDGLIYKLNYNFKIPKFILIFIINFLKGRSFKVKVNKTSSEYETIECGVPQGSVLGPLLFLIYINDIPLTEDKHKSFSTLYADDLGAFFIFKKNRNLESIINFYLIELEAWLSKWRLLMNAKKCQYTTFTSQGNLGNKKLKLKLKLYGEFIQYNPKPIFLGIIFDEYLCFKKHFESLRERALKRLNIIKIFSHKSWNLSRNTLCNIYKSLIGSIFNYSFFTFANISVESEKRIQTIQNRAIRCIFKLEFNSLTSELNTISEISPIKKRFVQLGCKYLSRTLTHNGFMVGLTREFLWSRSKLHKFGNKNTPIGILFTIISLTYGFQVWFFLLTVGCFFY